MAYKEYRCLARVTYVVLAVIFCLQAHVLAQTEQNAARPDRGIGPLGSYAVSDIETINLANGNLNLSIPLDSLPPIAGGKLSWTVRAIYNSKMWDVVREEVDSGVLDQFGNPAPPYVTSRLQPASQGGWHVGEMYSITFPNSREDFNWLAPACGIPFCPPEDCVLTQYALRKTILTTPDGVTHELRPLDYLPYQGPRTDLWGYYTDIPARTCNHNNCPPSEPCPTNTIRYYSFDGSFIWAKVFPDFTWELYLPDGTKIVQTAGVQRIVDTNGNSIKIYSDTNGAGHTVTHYLDERGAREITQEWIPGSGNSFVLRESYKLEGGVTSAIIDVNFDTISVIGKTYEVTDHFDLTGATCFRLEPLTQIPVDVVKSISLPPTEQNQTRSFNFSYNCEMTHSTTGRYQPTCDPSNSPPVGSDSIGWGSLSRIDTPSGATAKYTYSLDNVQELSSDIQAATGYVAEDAARESVATKELYHDGQPAPDVWTYTIGTMGGGSVVGPDGRGMQELIYAHDPAFSSVYGGQSGLGGMAYKTSQYDKAGLEKTRIERHWITLKFAGAYDISPGQQTSLTPFNPVVDVEYTTLLDSNGGLTNAKMTAKKFTYDYNGNLVVEQDFDWFSPSALPGRDAQGVPTGTPTGLQPIRVITNSYYNPAPLVTGGDTGPNSANVYARRLTSTATPLLLNAKKETTIASATTQLSGTQYSYDGNPFGTAPTTKGNLTLIRQQRDATTWIDTACEYDAYGNRTANVDPDGNRTELAYDTSTHAQPTSITVYPDRNDPNNKHITSILYDASTGLVLSQTDPNGKVQGTDYTNQQFKDAGLIKIDPYGRPGVVTDPQGRTTVTRYVDHLNKVNVTADLKVAGDGKLKRQTSHDMLGRVIKTESNEGGTSYTIASDTAYRYKTTGGQIVFTSNPYRSAGADTDGWTRSTRDEIGRVVEVATFSGATPPPDTGTTNTTGVVTMSYLTNQVTTTDQDLKTRNSTTDALGRLLKVTENPSGTPSYDTTYGYDALGNLTGVTQGTAPQTQTRTFTYDNLSRLKTAKNPEQVNTSGVQVATTYDYDAASNLLTKINPNNATVTCTYDGLNRVRTKVLSGGPSFTYTYDTGTNRKGRLVSVATANGDGYFYDTYDDMGRVTSSHQVTDGNPYSFSSYIYDLAGDLTSQTYPSGRVVTTAYDDAGRINGVTGQLPQQTAKTYADTFSYTAHGAVAAMKFGTDSSNPRWEHTSFNSRLQPTLIGIGTNSTTNSSILKLDYAYGSTNARNNGNIRQQTITIGSSVFTQDHGYDGLNRLHTATETVSSQTSWSQTYDYDRWGNRWVSANINYPLNATMTPQSQSQIDPATNRIIPAQMPVAGFSYDVSGNLDGDPVTGAHKISYDADNHQTSYNNGAATYVYDGEDRRVKKVVAGSPSVTTIYVYSAMGQMIAEYKDQSPSSSGTQFVASDYLGSSRLLMNSSGSVTARYDYLPFGEEIPNSIGGRSVIVGYNPVATINEKFTQKERDTESGLDYFLARYYSSAQGRFTSIDPKNAAANESDPQSWNGYAYARNNPLFFVDPNGETYVVSGPNGSGTLLDEVFLSEKKHFEGLGFIFTGNGTFFESGNIISPDGKVIASYQQVSIDDRFNRFRFEMSRRTNASYQAIGAFAGFTALAGSGIGGAAYLTGTALAGGGITTLGLSQAGVAQGTAAAETLVVSEATRQAFQRQLAQHGRAALEKSLRTLERRLAEHLAKVEVYRRAGGYTSSVEREIRIFRESIKAIKDILGK